MVAKQSQTKTFRFRITWKDSDGEEHTKRYFTYEEAYAQHKIPRNSYFALSRKEYLPKWKNYAVQRIRESAREMVQQFN